MAKYTSKQKKDILTKLTYKKINAMSYEDCCNMFKDLFPVGSKVKDCPGAFGDNDLWHIVSFLNDGDTQLVLAKSWGAYMRRWVYMTKPIPDTLYGISLSYR